MILVVRCNNVFTQSIDIPCRGDRWAHSGFKELYRDELGYPEAEVAAGGSAEDRPRDPRNEPKDPRKGSPRYGH